MHRANRLLGYEYSLSGTVGPGRKVGRRIGYPTANLVCGKDKCLPANGVYVTRLNVDGKSYNSITNIGYRPTFGESDMLSIEAFTLEPVGELYGRTVSISFVKFIRQEIRFENVELLKKQLRCDVLLASRYFEDIKKS